MAELTQFAAEVTDRFRNPFVNHALMSISLNSVSKFKSRLLPTMLAYTDKFGKLPPHIVFSLAALIVFYKGSYRNRTIAVNDDKPIMEFFNRSWGNCADNYQLLAKQVLANESFWGMDLTRVEGLEKQVANNIRSILEEDIMESISRLVG
jgi:tagaturonate reductase